MRNRLAPGTDTPDQAVQRVLALHVAIPEDVNSPLRCWEDGDLWPCATYRAVTGSQRDHGGEDGRP